MLVVTWDNFQDLAWDFNNFTPQELLKASHYGSFIWSKKLEDTMLGLDLLRDTLGAPIMVSNACRFRGSETSQHFFRSPFNAIDIYNPKLSSLELMEYVEKLNIFTGRGAYFDTNNGIVHVDTRRGLRDKTNGRVSRWYRDKNGRYHTVTTFSEIKT